MDRGCPERILVKIGTINSQGMGRISRSMVHGETLSGYKGAYNFRPVIT